MEKLVQAYRALSEETRLRIMMLLTHGELCVCDVMEILDEPQAKVSRHLAYLKHSGLVQSKRVGVWMHYSLKNGLDNLLTGQIRFLAEEASHLPVFEDDLKKMEDVKRKKLCENSSTKTPPRSPSRSKKHPDRY